MPILTSDPIFSLAARRFLRDLADNNSKPWFEANRARYEADVEGPSVLFVTTLGARLQAIDPAIRVDPRTSGSGTLMRIYRDTRFSADKSPYKTNVSGLFGQGAGKKLERPAFGFQLDADGLRLMAGIFAFPKAMLPRYREAVVDDAQGAELLAALTAVRQAGPYETAGLHYKRLPDGFTAEGARAELLRHDGLYVHPPLLPWAQVTSPALVDACAQHFRQMAPVYHWLVHTIFANA